MSVFIEQPNLLQIKNALIPALSPEAAAKAGITLMKLLNNGSGLAGSRSRTWQMTCTLFLTVCETSPDGYKLYSVHRHEINQPDLYVTPILEDWSGLPYRYEDNSVTIREEKIPEETRAEQTSNEIKSFSKVIKFKEGFWIQIPSPGTLAKEGIFISPIQF